jgi:hypothetical protein
MKKLITVFLSALLLLTVFVFSGCEKSSSVSEYGVIEIEVISPDGVGVGTDVADTLTVGDSLTVTSKLTGFTFEYAKINYYFGTNEIPVAVFTKEMINDLAEEQEKDAQFEFTISTNGLAVGDINLTVEAISNDYKYSVVTVPLVAKLPGVNDSALDFVVLSPANNTQFKIGDKIAVEVGLEGTLTLYDNFSVYLSNSTEPIYESNIADVTKEFEVNTENFAVGSYRIKMDLELKTEEITTKYLDFSLIEYIPTFVAEGAADGYQLKSLIQTYDNGYLAVSSYAPTLTTGGTRIVKYDAEGVVQWTQNLPASIGFGESVCEDTEYDKGYVIAGWRYNGTSKDTWVRKITQTDGSLIWNKDYGIDFSGSYFDTDHDGNEAVDDGATIIRKSVDDGYIIGGYSYNPWGTDSFRFYYETSDGLTTDTVTVESTWETGYDVRMLKIYSNGNEVWGNNQIFSTHRMWHDISLHYNGDSQIYWMRTMGDQFITDLTLGDNGNYYITGWNNFRLYYSDGWDKKDMFFAECDEYGSYVSTMTWSRMYSSDEDFTADEDAPYGQILNTDILGSNSLGDVTEDEIGYGIVKSQGDLGGQVAMAGMTHQTDSKARLDDGWVVDFWINQDEDGALWEYAFGETSKNDKSYGISITKDGGYVVTGYKTGTDMNTWLFKLDSKMSLLWSKDFGVAGNDTGVKVLQTTDGGFIIGGNVGTGATAKSKLIKVNKTGDIAK